MDGTGETLSSSLSSGVDQGQGQSQCRGKDNAQGDASMRRPRRRQERHKRCRRRQHETLPASPTQVSVVPPPRYPQVGKTVEGDEIEEVKASLMASPPRYPQVGKTVEGDEIAKRQRITSRVVPRYLWEGKTMEGTTPPPPRALGVFRHSGTIRRCCSRPLLRRGRRALRIKGRIALVLETPRGRYGPDPIGHR